MANLANEKRQNFCMVASINVYRRDLLCAFSFFLIPSFFLLLEWGHEGWNSGGSLVREMALEMEPIKKGQQDGKVSVSKGFVEQHHQGSSDRMSLDFNIRKN